MASFAIAVVASEPRAVMLHGAFEFTAPVFGGLRMPPADVVGLGAVLEPMRGIVQRKCPRDALRGDGLGGERGVSLHEASPVVVRVASHLVDLPAHQTIAEKAGVVQNECLVVDVGRVGGAAHNAIDYEIGLTRLEEGMERPVDASRLIELAVFGAPRRLHQAYAHALSDEPGFLQAVPITAGPFVGVEKGEASARCRANLESRDEQSARGGRTGAEELPS